MIFLRGPDPARLLPTSAISFQRLFNLVVLCIVAVLLQIYTTQQKLSIHNTEQPKQINQEANGKKIY